jgi:hypothetical protein
MDPGGSIIDCRNQILAQQVSIPGTPYALRYQSERAPGRLPTIDIPITGSSWPPSPLPLRVGVQIEVAGNTYSLSYDPSSLTPSETVPWTWNQQDVFGNTVEGLQLATVTLSYYYAPVYLAPALVNSGAQTFSSFDSFSATGTPISGTAIRALNQIAISTTNNVRIGVAVRVRTLL